MKIYVASSWRNKYQQSVVETLRSMGHEVYDFRNPPNGDKGFAWSDIDENWEAWSTDEYDQALSHPIAERGFKNDFDGMKWADCCLMVLPCGRSANTEAGWMKGVGKEVYIFQPEKCEPELMYKMHDGILSGITDLYRVFTKKQPKIIASEVVRYNTFIQENIGKLVPSLRDHGAHATFCDKLSDLRNEFVEINKPK